MEETLNIKDFLCTITLPSVSHSSFVIHMFPKGLSDVSTHPPIQADRARSGGAYTRSRVFVGAIVFRSSISRFPKSSSESHCSISYFV